SYEHYKSVGAGVEALEPGFEFDDQEWVEIDKKLQQSGVINSIKEDLIDIDKKLDGGNISNEILLKRMELTRKLHDINQMEARDYVQKSKIKWAIEGDENSKFFHGIINKKRYQLSIRGVFVDGDWNTDPEFYKLLVSALTGASGFEALLVPQWLRSWLMGALLMNSLFLGLKQGDPLASYLFILIMESLHIFFSRATSDGLFKVCLGNLLGLTRFRSYVPGYPSGRLKLSIGGRLTLLKSVLGASPLYNMSIYKVPKGVLKEMEAIRCNFFNGSDPAERKITWVSWDKVLASKKNGGLGVSSFHELNRALLLKWVWRFLSQDGSLWYRVIQALYGASFELHHVNQSSILCSILREMQVLISKGFDFVSHYRWICDLNGDGVFRVKEVRTILDDIFLNSAADATRWVKYIPIKINVFAWRARLDRLPTRSNLVRRGVVLDSSLCPLCGLVLEDVHHVLFRFDTAKLVFRRICRWWDLDWHDLLSFSDWNAWFSAIRLPSRIKLILDGVFYVAWWHLWVYRNQSILQRLFQDVQ
nr:RNA-directed DNA polymerase, eukaryota [Tanacetum cinerariifolium]